MKKLMYKGIKGQITSCVSINDFTQVYTLSNGKYLKLFHPMLLEMHRQNGSDMEKKVMSADKLNIIPEIIKPDAGIYYDGLFVGYTMPAARGIDSTMYEARKSIQEKLNLKRYASEFCKLEDAIKRANKKGIAFPDLLTCENMFIDNGKYQFIDFDGIQIDGYKVLQMSSLLGSDSQYFTPKYINNNNFFNSNLDKKSLVILYYLTVFNVNLNSIGKYNPMIRRLVTLDDMFAAAGITDDDFKQATFLAMCDKENDNVYIGDLVNKIADENTLRVIATDKSGLLMRKLVRK